MKKVTIKLPEGTAQEIEKVSTSRGLTTSAQIRQWIDSGLRRAGVKTEDLAKVIAPGCWKRKGKA